LIYRAINLFAGFPGLPKLKPVPQAVPPMAQAHGTDYAIHAIATEGVFTQISRFVHICDIGTAACVIEVILLYCNVAFFFSQECFKLRPAAYRGGWHAVCMEPKGRKESAESIRG
jgi:hypothetical protein